MLNSTAMPRAPAASSTRFSYSSSFASSGQWPNTAGTKKWPTMWPGSRSIASTSAATYVSHVCSVPTDSKRSLNSGLSNGHGQFSPSTGCVIGMKWTERMIASGRIASTMFCASGRERGSLSTSAPIE